MSEPSQISLADWLSAVLAGEPPPAWPGWPPSFSDEPAAAGQPPAARPPALLADGGPYVELTPDPAGDDGAGDGEAPLAGFTFAVKNMVAVAGVLNRSGSRSLLGAAPEPRDAAAVAALRAAGARCVGVTAMHEHAFGATGVNAFEGTPANPWDPKRIPGGSSSGSAVAVAEGSARVALGTDTGGSVRIPAALCGVVGFKPSRGRYPLDGVLPLSPTLDHLGLFAVNVEDAARVDAVLTGDAPAPPTTPSFVFSDDHLRFAAPATRARLEAAVRQFEAAGASVAAAELPSLELAFAITTAILLTEAARVHERTLSERGELLGADVRERLEAVLALPNEIYEEALTARGKLTAELERTLGVGTLMIGPSVGVTAPRLEQTADPTMAACLVAHTRLGNASGWPAISLPLPGGGLPLGLQLLGRADGDVLAAAAWAEAVLSR
ncbi:MAG TPA: amidase [Solirubrobacterales bacterium]|nr:amidase [Solirubrobacterales bacterium]